MKIFALLLILSVGLILLSGCVDDPQDTVVCISPYIHTGSSCCLDANNNSVCDEGEVSIKGNTTSEVDVQEGTSQKPVLPKNTLDKIPVNEVNASEDKKCETDPLKMRALTINEATKELISFLKNTTNGSDVNSGEGLTFEENFLIKDSVYFYLKYTEWKPANKKSSFMIHKAYSKKNLSTTFNEDNPPFFNYVKMFPGRTESIFKTEYSNDESADGIIDRISIISCEGYDICDYDLEIYDKTVYTKEDDSMMVNSYTQGEYTSNLSVYHKDELSI